MKFKKKYIILSIDFLIFSIMWLSFQLKIYEAFFIAIGIEIFSLIADLELRGKLKL